MVELLAQTTQAIPPQASGTGGDWIPMVVVAVSALGGALGSQALLVWGTRKNEEAKRRIELRGELLAASEEVLNRCNADLRSVVTSRVFSHLHRLQKQGRAHENEPSSADERALELELRRRTEEPNMGKVFGRLLQVLGEMRWYFKRNKTVVARVDDVLDKILGFDPTSFDTKIPEELGEEALSAWEDRKMNEGAEFLGQRIYGPARSLWRLLREQDG